MLAYIWLKDKSALPNKAHGVDCVHRKTADVVNLNSFSISLSVAHNLKQTTL